MSFDTETCKTQAIRFNVQQQHKAQTTSGKNKINFKDTIKRKEFSESSKYLLCSLWFTVNILFCNN